MPEQENNPSALPADERIHLVEQQLETLQRQLQSRSEELGTAEAQRDEARQQLVMADNRLAVERLLSQAGVVDVEAASLLLSRRLDLAEEIESDAISRAVEKLLLDKPFLRSAPPAGLPPRSSSAKSSAASLSARLAQTAERAARSGDRRDVAEYLRLRRRMALSQNK